MAIELSLERLSKYRAAVDAGFYNEGGGPADSRFTFRDAQVMISVLAYRLSHLNPSAIDEMPKSPELILARGESSDALFVPKESATIDPKAIPMDWSE